MTRLKICGITRLEDAVFCAEAGADALGFIFANSPRRISAEAARDIIRKLPPFVQTLGVFVGDDPEAGDIAAYCGLGALQLHCDYTGQYVRSLSDRRLVLGVRIGPGKPLEAPPALELASAVLLDTFAQDAAGGTGRTFDWSAVGEARAFGKPVILSGGLTPGNAREAAATGAYALDVSSGVESAPGIKDHGKIRKFIEQARAHGS